jgi:hypothetical protein
MVMKKWVSILFICFISSSLPQINQFHLFDENNSPLDVSNLRSLAIDSVNNIWIGGSFLFKYETGNWITMDTLLELDSVPGFVMDIEIESEGDIWFCKFYHPFYNYHTLYSSNNGWIEYYNAVGTSHIYATKLFVEDSDNLWVTFYNGWPHQLFKDKIGMYSSNSWEIYDREGLYYAGDLVVEDDTIYVITVLGLYKGDGISWILHNPDDWLPMRIWRYNKKMFVGGEKLSSFNGNEYIPINEINVFLEANLTQVSSINFDKDSILWVGTKAGHILRVQDSLEVVTQYEGNGILEIEIDKYNNKWILIHNVGLLIYNEDGILDVKNDYDFTEPTRYLLSQNYPNPFNPTTKIKLTIPVTLRGVEGSHATLKVYDVLGNEIAILVHEEKQVGTYEVEFDGTGLPSGVYFYQFRAGKYTATKKMVLLK